MSTMPPSEEVNPKKSSAQNHTKHEKSKTLAELPSENGHSEKRLVQNYTKLSKLVTHAESIKKDFTDWVKATAKKYGGTAELGHMLKDPDSAKRKTWKHVKKHNHGLAYPETAEEWDRLDFSGIFDYLRSTIVVPDLQQLRKLAKELETDQQIEVKRIKDRYFPQGSLPVDDGYRDIQYILEFHPKGANLPKDFMIELQLNVAAAIDLKETLIYEIYRQDAPCETEEQLHELMKKTDEIIKILRKKGYSVVTLEKIKEDMKDEGMTWNITKKQAAALEIINQKFHYKLHSESVSDLINVNRHKREYFKGEMRFPRDITEIEKHIKATTPQSQRPACGGAEAGAVEAGTAREEKGGAGAGRSAAS